MSDGRTKKCSTVNRVEKHRIRPSSPYYKMLREFCHLSKNLYNHANYLVRQAFKETGKYMDRKELEMRLRSDEEYPDYRAMPGAQSAQQTLRLLDRNWKSFFAAIKDWKVHPEKYPGRPRMPQYKRKDGYLVLIMTNQACQIKQGRLHFLRIFNGFTVVPLFIKNIDAYFLHARFVPVSDGINLELVYRMPDAAELPDNGRYASIDIGVNNLAAVATNTEAGNFLVKGTPLKAMNQFYNKQLAKKKSICERMNGRHSSQRIAQLTGKRNRKVSDYLHKASRSVVNWCAENQITSLVIGQNKGWKQDVELGKKMNQHFVQIPFANFIQMLQYKAADAGIKVIVTEESYTSGTSFLDGELPTKDFYNKKRRVHRGLFIANDGRKINADINGAFQIMKKVFPNVHADGIEGAVSRPAVVVL
jgi:putative transposase